MKMEKLKNRYLVLRHGESKANAAEIILSDPEEGIKKKYTLTLEGENQIRRSVEQAKEGGLLDGVTIIYSSPFSRSKKSAEISKEVLDIKDEIRFDDRLRERWFGVFDKKDNDNYHRVWNLDKENPKHKEFEVESAQEVQERALSLIKDLEDKYANKKILLVSHGDVLQIMQTGVLNKSAKEHRQLPHLNVAEIRELK